jgi:pyridoxal/pyridoxine/pyridoxamine kinase
MNTAMIQSIAEMIVESANDSQTAINIREMHKSPQGAETLRLIVRDNIAGAGDIIANALWANL